MKDILNLAVVNFAPVWGDWKPEKYIEWYREAQETNFWGKEPQQ